MDCCRRLAFGPVLAMSLCVGNLLLADEVPAESIATLREMADAAMEAIRKDDVPGFIDALAGRAGWNEEQRLKNLQKISESRGVLRTTLGPGEDNVEFVKTQTIGSSLVRLIYLEHRAGGAVAWRFTLYRPRNEWRLIGMTWDSNIESLFRDAPASPASAVP